MKAVIGTRKGLLQYEKINGKWKSTAHDFLGIPVTMFLQDERNGIWWAGLSHGHWGQKLHMSEDKGKTWKEVETPKYPEGYEIKEGKAAKLNLMWAMAAAGADKPNTLHIGTEPGGFFTSNDYGKSWQLCESLWQDPDREKHWFGGGFDNAAIHSIEVNPNNSNHIYIGISCGGVYESLDGGQNWKAQNNGLVSDFLPNQTAEVGHDPHLLKMCLSKPEVLWQQAHCGIWVSKDGAQSWQDVRGKDKNADFGFNITIDHNNPNRAWVAPGISDEIRVAVDGALCISRTEDGGQTWQAFRNGLPQKNCSDIVYRHAMDRLDNTLVFGTTTGNIFFSNDDGETWEALSHYSPMVHTVNLLSD